jgi:hypothetical protein
VSEKTENLTATVAVALRNNEPPTKEVMLDLVRNYANLQTLTSNETFTEDEILLVVKSLQERFAIHMGMGTLFSGEDYTPWLDESKVDIDWHYWGRYEKLLIANGIPSEVVRTLNRITDQILDHLENPNKEGSWARKGMVMGHVQSGKTANYAGLICKAADSGYRVIIVLAGMLNSLRNQTQERIDEGFLGWSTKHKIQIGSAVFGNTRRPVCFTTSVEDFKKHFATQISVSIESLKEPVILVIKKHQSTLENLRTWLTDNNPHNLKDLSMLLIDDEADHASINTNVQGKDATAINRGIRKLLKLFVRSSFLGYTATPFANVFIDPETEHEMLGDDLFPRDFIISLDPPDNYVGASRIFTRDADLKILRDVTDNETWLPLRHKIDFRPRGLPESLQEAIRCFILARATRLLREQVKIHNSMMINVSRFTNLQLHIAGLLDERLKQILQAVRNYSQLPEAQAQENEEIAELRKTWAKEFADTGVSWLEVQHVLKEAVSPIAVIAVNSASAEKLDYSPENYPNGRNVIAVGGLGLSRGLTLEGLTVSYFLRNSVMYDTLMQMGRWFGYRDGYSDLCRIFMTPDAASWYGHIAEVTEELRSDFKSMKMAGMTPKDFGLRIRSHPDSLIVTARNKMRLGRGVPKQIDLAGRLAETSVIFVDPENLERNLACLYDAADQAKRLGKQVETELGLFWKEVPSSVVRKLVSSYRNHPACLITAPEPLINYIEWLEQQEFPEWNVLLRSVKRGEADEISVGDLMITPQTRNDVIWIPRDRPKFGIEFRKRRVASRGDERVGLSQGQIDSIKREYESDNKSVPDSAYRKVEGRPPTLMLHLISCKAQKPDWSAIVPAWGLSFPGEANTRRPKKLVEYIVNPVWWKDNYGDLDEDEVGDDE